MLCRVAIGPGLAQWERLEPSAIAFDPLMRSTGPSGHRRGAQGRYKVTGTDTARVRGQFRPKVTVGAGQRQCPDGRADVVLCLTTLAFPTDREHGSSEKLFNTLLQLLIPHSEHLQLPITRCYLLLERTLRVPYQGRCLDDDPLGQQQAQCGGQLRQGDLARSSRFEAQVEVLAKRLTARRQGQAEADERVRHESLRVRQRQPAAAQRPLPHAGHVPVAGETDLSRLGEAQAEAALTLRGHG